MNKKGESSTFLPEEVIRIIVAIIGIGLLVYIVFLFISNSTADKAKASMNNVIYAEIERLNSGGEENPSGILVPNPSNWEIIGFTGEIKPNLCIGENCICICDVYAIDSVKTQAEKCDQIKKGFCVPVKNLLPFKKIKILSDGVYLSIKKINGTIEVKQWT
jgi:hypothetical protein